MTVYESLKSDHDKVEKLLQKLNKAQGAEADERTFQTMKTELILHSRPRPAGLSDSRRICAATDWLSFNKLNSTRSILRHMASTSAERSVIS